MTKSNFNYIILWMHSAVKEVLILSGSPRKGGNSDILCDEFLRGAFIAPLRYANAKLSVFFIATNDILAFSSFLGKALDLKLTSSVMIGQEQIYY